MEEKKGGKMGISGSGLKLIALLSMLIDHIGAAVLFPLIFESTYFQTHRTFMGAHSEQLLQIYRVMRMIGRLAFPIYCFLLIEGYFHTKSRKKLLFRLFLFALISEIPFDLASNRAWFVPESQNVFFTLGLGFLGVWGYDRLAKANPRNLLRFVFLFLPMGAAHLLSTDYGWFGVACIFLFYFFYAKPLQRNLALVISFAWEITAPLALIPIQLYNGKRGWKMKYAFYLFYPLHLAVLYAVYLRCSG